MGTLGAGREGDREFTADDTRWLLTSRWARRQDWASAALAHALGETARPASTAPTGPRTRAETRRAPREQREQRQHREHDALAPSTPALNANMTRRAPARWPNSRSTLATKPWTNPKPNAMGTRGSRAPGFDRRFSTPTYTMLSAMSGSMSRAGGLTIWNAASASVTLWASVNAVTILSTRPALPPKRSRPITNRM